MTPPRTTRRHAVVTIMVVGMLVLGGLGWATRSAIQLDRIEAQAARERSLDETRAVVLSRLDALAAPVLNRELSRPYEYFRPYYKPVGAMDEQGRADLRSVLLPSPLRRLRGPAWLLLHFQVTETADRESWSSPQIEEDPQFSTPVWAIPPADRPRRVGPENWLAALRQRYTPLELLQRLEQVVKAVGAEAGPSREGAAADADNRSPTPDEHAPGDGPPDAGRSAAEFLRRGIRLVQLQSEDRPNACWPETVAFENLEAGAPAAAPGQAAVDCVNVRWTTMEPVWLDLTLDGHKQLAFLRTVSVETGDFCTLQGVLIDWPQLRDMLEDEAGRFFPQARIVPVPTDLTAQLNVAHTLMQTVPARLDIGPPILADAGGISTGLTVGLIVAWAATIVALAAVSYGVMKYLGHVERRMRFVSAVTHELRTPLTSFQLYGDLLADMPKEDASLRRQYAEMLRREAGRLARLVENVLAYSRMGSVQPVLRLQKLRPRELLDQVASATAEQCSAAGKTLVIEDHCPAALAIETDPEFVSQILTNLVENACKYSSGADDPRIWLTVAEESAGGVAIEVDDAGPGVAPQDRKEVFEPFRRGRPPTVKQSGGVGLGLALSRYWASCLNGQLSLRRSQRDGRRYTSFVLTLPTQ